MGAIKPPSPPTDEGPVSVTLDHTTAMWVVKGRGPTLRFTFKAYDAAEAEAKRRVGWQERNPVR
jgi:hypothetical protein